MGDVAEIYEAMGSDAEKDIDPEAFVDNEGNPIRFRKKKKQMCECILKREKYADHDIQMKKEDKYFVDRNTERVLVQDPKNKNKQKQVICLRGKDCPYAHNPIELDLIPIQSNISNLQGIVKSQSIKLKNAKPIEPWRPAASNFDPSCK